LLKEDYIQESSGPIIGRGRLGFAVQGVTAGYAIIEGNCFQQLPIGQRGLEINRGYN